MRKTLLILLTLMLFLISTIATSIAAPRHYSTSYRGNFHPRSYLNHRYYYPNHRIHRGYRGYYYNSHDFWAPLGVGLLTGAVVGSILSQPPRQRTVVYNRPPVYVQTDPIIVQQRYIRSPAAQEVILKRVTITAKLLNIRMGPGIENEVIGQVEQGTTLDVFGASADWLYIKIAPDQYGWIMSKYTSEAESPVG